MRASVRVAFPAIAGAGRADLAPRRTFAVRLRAQECQRPWWEKQKLRSRERARLGRALNKADAF
eukprot:15460318-Alexandrium_andersonii.AAC.1